MQPRAFLRSLGVAVVAITVCAGCRIQADLSSSPNSVKVGQPVTFDVTLTNRSTCPVGGVTALLFPFVPKDICISKIEDPDLREELSQAVESFCTGGGFQIPGGVQADCRLVDGDVICSLSDEAMAGVTGGDQPEITLVSTEGSGQVTCRTQGSVLSCTIPESMVEMGEQMAGAASSESGGGAASSLLCGGVDGIGICIALGPLGPGEMGMGQLELVPETGGVLRNWILAFSRERNDGVCKNLVPNIPCDTDSDCPGPTKDCGTGICVGGSNDGFGCDNAGECPGAGSQCVQCEVLPDGDLLAGLSCTTTQAAFRPAAPTMSPRGLLAGVLLLIGVAYFALRRVRRYSG